MADNFANLFMSTGKNTEPVSLNSILESKGDDKARALLAILKDCMPEIEVRYGECQESESSVKPYEGEAYGDWKNTKDALLEWSQTPFGAMTIYEYTRSHDLMVDTEDGFRVCFKWQGV